MLTAGKIARMNSRQITRHALSHIHRDAAARRLMNDLREDADAQERRERLIDRPSRPASDGEAEHEPEPFDEALEGSRRY